MMLEVRRVYTILLMKANVVCPLFLLLACFFCSYIFCFRSQKETGRQHSDISSLQACDIVNCFWIPISVKTNCSEEEHMTNSFHDNLLKKECMFVPTVIKRGLGSAKSKECLIL
ncbi:uncharacterized protein EV154DRAFT_551779 [Mucor mucedo]|uniref:uncharacterized protein n=1 Tax=Mucor mucedo TaxID=29922 RepID=UPI00221E9CB4|nr:uncharacterized protein EV154DRAFT_551779 [Mucor mucedo]KAI7891112.1 hypothetical protein EV154DRAFT_551779 [Mucor mucedo]